MYNAKAILLVSLLMFSRVTLAWPATISKTIGTGTLEVTFDTGATAGTTSVALTYTNSVDFDGTAAGDIAMACAVADSATWADSDTNNGFVVKIDCPASKILPRPLSSVLNHLS